jgi:predicted metalloprotease with PDZ domain
VTEAEVEALFDEVSGLKLRTLFDKYIRGTEDLPLAKLFAPFGVKLADERKNSKPSLDAGIGRDPLGAKLTQVHEGGAAHQAGLSALDIVIAIDGLRVNGNPSNVDTLLSRYRVGDKVTVHAFRRDELMAQLPAPLKNDVTKRVDGMYPWLDGLQGPARPSRDRLPGSAHRRQAGGRDAQARLRGDGKGRQDRHRGGL